MRRTSEEGDRGSELSVRVHFCRDVGSVAKPDVLPTLQRREAMSANTETYRALPPPASTPCCRLSPGATGDFSPVPPHLALLCMMETARPVDGNVTQPVVQLLGTFYRRACIQLAEPAATSE